MKGIILKSNRQHNITLLDSAARAKHHIQQVVTLQQTDTRILVSVSGYRLPKKFLFILDRVNGSICIGSDGKTVYSVKVGYSAQCMEVSILSVHDSIPLGILKVMDDLFARELEAVMRRSWAHPSWALIRGNMSSMLSSITNDSTCSIISSRM